MPQAGHDEVDELGHTAAAPSQSDVGAFDATQAQEPAAPAVRRGAGGTAFVRPTGDEPASPPPPLPPSRDDAEFLRPFGPFSKVEALTEQGAMGLVARGYNAAFDRWELLKFLRAEYASNAELIRQFHREGRILAKLSHPNVVQVFAIYALDGQPCLAMEFLEGESLKQHVTRQGGKLPLTLWVELFVAAARGLSAAHDAGLLHRDIKPENLFVTFDRKGAPSTLKLIDFGLATADRAHAGGTDPSLVAAMSGGTPLYMAPELWSHEEASPRSDIWALGISFYVAATGRLPYEVGRTMAEVSLAVCAEGAFPDARSLRPEMPQALSAVLSRTLAKRREQRFATADELLASLLAAASAARPRKIPGAGPYRGLESFSAAERDVFFGRDVEVAEVLERLRGQAGVLLVGPSGSGKSSMAHAGVVPQVEDGALGGGVVFSSVRFEPRARPVLSMAAALARASGASEKEMATFLRTTPDKLGEALRAALPEGAGLVVVVDQLEEIATIAEDQAEVRDFCAAVASLVEVVTPSLRLVATVRADLMDRLFSFETLRPLLTRGFYPVRPLVGDALRRALEGPALAAGYSLEDPRVADAIVSDVEKTQAGLPLLSFAMASWWEKRDEARRVLPTAAWQALGGVAGALARHGDGVLSAMGAEERKAAERVLVRLVSADGTRSRASRSSLVDPLVAGPSAERALSLLLSSKLLHESAGEVELAHEALISRWPALRDLIALAGEDHKFRERVSSAAREWDGQGRPDGALWTGEQATRLLRWLATTPSALDQTELSFIEAVRKREARGRLVTRSLVAGVVLVAITMGLSAKGNEREMRERLAEATKQAAKLKGDYQKAEAGRLRMLAEARMHDEPAAAVRAALDSYNLAPSSSLDVLAWKARAQGAAFPLPVHAGGASLVRVSPKGGWVATAGADGSVRVLATQGPERAKLRASKEKGVSVRAMVFSPSGDTLAIASTAGEVSLAKASSFSPVVAVKCDEHAIDALYHRSGTLYVRCSEGGGRLIAVEPGDKHAHHDVYRGPLAAFALAEAGDIGTYASPDGKIVIFDGKSGATVGSASLAKTSGLTAVEVSPDGKRLVVGEQDGSLRAGKIDAGKPGELALLPVRHTAAVLAMSHGPEQFWLSVGADRTARLHGLAKSFSVDIGAPAFVWAPKRSAVMLTGRANDVVVFSLLAGEPVGRLLGASADVTAIDVDAEARWAFVSSRDGGVRAYALDEAVVSVTQGPANPAPRCAISGDGTSFACLGSSGAEVKAVANSAGGPKASRTVALPPQTSSLAVSHRGEKLVAVAAGKLLVEGAEVALPFAPALVAAGNSHAAVATRGGEKGQLAVVPLAGGDPRTVAIAQPPQALSFSRDGEKLHVATRSAVHVVTLSSLATTSIPLAHQLPDGDPQLVVASDDGGRFALALSSGQLLALSSKGGDEAPVGSVRGNVSCLLWSQGGRALVAGSSEKRVTLFDTENDMRLPLASAASALVGCGRSPIDDRFSFAQADGTVWLRLLELSSVTTGKPTDDALSPTAMPIESWAGLPLGPLR